MPPREPSPPSEPPQRLVIGQAVRPWGVGGALKVQILSEFPQRFLELKEVYVAGELRGVEGARPHQGMVVVKLAGCDTREQAEALRGALLEVAMEDAVSLPEGRYYVHQVVGLEVWTGEGQYLGRVSEVLPTGSNDVYLVRSGRRELAIPAIERVVREVDLEEGRLVVEPLEKWC